MIYTFYSYKGGVGRSMALANVAELFYQAGLRVLMVDWDLEAPGLERFFPIDLEEVLDRPGIMDMLLGYKKQMSQKLLISEGKELPFEKPSQLVVDIYPDSSDKGKLYLLTAGRRSKEHFAEYASSLLNFDWQDFYLNWEGELYFEWLRQQFQDVADVVLMDSRTGVTEMGGVCTYQFADVVVMFCAPNQQNLSGIYEMANNFKRPEVQKLRQGRPLDILIVPSRVEDRAETWLLNEFHETFTDKFDRFMPKVLGGGLKSFWDLMIPHVPYYAFNERVVVRERGKAGSEDMVNAFGNLANLMARFSSFPDIFRDSKLTKYSVQPQNLRDFTVQIREALTDAVVGTGIVVSGDIIITSAHVMSKATGTDPCEVETEGVDPEIGVYFPQASAREKARRATIAARSSQYDDDIVLLRLKDGPAPLGQEQFALLGTAEDSSGHPFRSYGFSHLADYSAIYANGTILGEVDASKGAILRENPLQLESGQIMPGMCGAAVLDIENNLVVGIVSEVFSPDKQHEISLAVNARVLTFEPFNLPVQVNMGDVYAQQGKYKNAAKAYREALEIDPRLASAWMGLGNLYARQEKNDEAIEAYEKALKLDGELASAWRGLGDVCTRQTYYEWAIEAYEKAVSIDPELVSVWVEMGDLYAHQNRNESAIKAYTNAIEIDPKLASAWRELGNIYSQQNNHENAINAYRKAVEIDPKAAPYWQKLGDVYTQQSLYDEAIECYKKAIEIDPEKESEIASQLDMCRQQSKKQHKLVYKIYDSKPLVYATLVIFGILLFMVPNLINHEIITAPLWDVNTGEEVGEMGYPVWDIAFSPDGKYLVTAVDDNVVRVLNADSGKEIKKLNHSSRVTDVAFAPVGTLLATASSDNTIRLWDVVTGDESRLLVHPGVVNYIDFSPDGRYLAIASDNETSGLWDLTNDQQLMLNNKGLERILLAIIPIFQPALASTDNIIYSTSPNAIQMIDYKSRPEIHVIPYDKGGYATQRFEEEKTLTVQPTSVKVVTFSSDGKYLATARDDNTARVWNLSRGEIEVIISHNASVNFVAFSPDGTQLATASSDNTARVWNTTTGNETAKLYHDGSVNFVVFSPDGTRLATASSDKTARVWNATTGKEIAKLFHNGSVNFVSFSTDGKLVATASSDQTARIWNLITGHEISMMKHNYSVWKVAFSPNTKQLATASWDEYLIPILPRQYKVTLQNSENYMIVWNPPREMILGEGYMVQGIIGGNVSNRQVLLAELDGTRFDISSITPREQVMTGDHPIYWKWWVLPKEYGKHSLTFHAYIVNTEALEFNIEYLGVCSQDILVMMPPMTLSGKVREFVASNWIELLNLIVVLTTMSIVMLMIRQRRSS